MKFHFAPLQGLTDTIYQAERAKWYDPLDFCYTPFIRTEKGEPRRQDINRLREAKGKVKGLIPQIIFRDLDEFLMLAQAVKDMGYSSIDLNLGCPHPMQTKKGRGAAMIARPDALRQVCECIKNDHSASYSAKLRLGLDDPSQWRGIIDMLNDTPLHHITLHPRTAKQMYSGEIDHEMADQFFSECKIEKIYNGDIIAPKDIEETMRMHPSISGIMIGRGLIARPSLIMEFNQGQEWTMAERIARIKEFHKSLMREYSGRLCGECQILQKIKPYWALMESEIGHKAAKAISKAKTMAQYEKAISAL